MRMRTMIGWVAALGVTAGFAACSLHLDKSKIAGKDGGASTGGSAGNGAGGSSASGGGGGTMEAGTECDASTQCKSDAACVQGTCNNGNCVYALCPSTQACTASSCDPQTKTCSAPQPYGFLAGTISVGKNLGCGNSAARCIAAMGNYVFVGTQNGLKAWQVTNPKAPVSIPVNPQPLFATTINRLVSNGKRLLILDSPNGSSLNVAWVDLPTAAAPTSIPTTSVGLQFSDTFSTSYPADNDGFFLVKNDPTNFFPSTRLDFPLQDNSTISLNVCNALPTTDSIVAASGSRLIQYHTDSSTGPFKPVFGFVNDAGLATSQYVKYAQDITSDTGEVPVSLAAHRFASTYNGALLWSTNNILNVDAGVKMSDSVVFRWPLLNSTDTTFNGKRSVVVEQYPTQYDPNTSYAGPMAEISPTTALVTTAYPGDPTGQTSVRAIQRNGDKLTVASTTAYTVAFSPGAIGIAAGRTFGYVLVPSTGANPPDTRMYIFDPACAK